MAKLIEITGKAISGEWGIEDADGSGIPVLRTTNFTNEGIVNYENIVTRKISKKNIDKKYLIQGDIIIEKSGGSDKQPVGRVVFFEGLERKYLFNNFTGLLRIKDKDKWEPKYVFYSLYSNYRKGGTKAFENKTTGLHNLKTDDYISKFNIKDTAIEEQRSICRKLDAICEIIKLKQEQFSKLDELIKSQFVEMFGDPEDNTKSLPMFKLSKLCKVGSSKRIYQNEQSIAGIPFLRISDLNDRIDKGIETAELFIPFEKYTELQEQGLVPRFGDILVTSRGTLGKCYIVKKTDNFYFQDGMISWLSEMDKNVTSLYITHLFAMPGIQKQIVNLQAGSTVAYLSIAMLKKLDIMLPPIEMQHQYSSFVCQVDKLKSITQKSIDELQTLFGSLMQKYFG